MKRFKLLSCIYFIFVIVLSVFVMIYKNDIIQFSTFGYFGVFICCFLANASVMLPAPGLVVVLTASLAFNPFIVAMVAAFGMSLGECIGYYLGVTGKYVLKGDKYEKFVLESLMTRECSMVFLFAVLPFPVFDIVGILAGFCKMKLYAFISFCFLGKLIKSFFVALISPYIFSLFENLNLI